MHVKNPVGDFSPTGFVEQPEFMRERKELDFLGIVIKVASRPSPHVHTTMGSLFFLIFLANVFKMVKIMV